MRKIIVEMLEELPDPRRGNAIRHNLTDIMLIAILTVFCNGNTFVAMELFGQMHESALREFLELPYGIPSHDTFADVFSGLRPECLSQCFQKWLGMICPQEHVGEHIAIDGKTARGSKSRGAKALHVVTAFASEVNLVLGQVSTDEKSNEITAIPKLLGMLDIKGKTVTIDAMGTQTKIAEQITEQGGSYLLALKENHPTLYDDISLYLEKEILPLPKNTLRAQQSYHETTEKNHGRIERRECYLCNDISWLSQAEQWVGLRGFGVIISRRNVIGEAPSLSRHFFLHSIPDATAERLLILKRSHWSIENNLHWMLDVHFGEDSSRVRLEHAAENLNLLRKLVLQLLKADASTKGSMTSKRLRCSYDLSIAFNIISQASS